jgi:ATP-dependent RNA helicase SUPV3L1/SUV3
LSGDPFNPALRLLTEHGARPARERASRRLAAFVAAESRRRFPALARLGRAIADDRLQGLARGIAWRLTEAGGVIDRREVEPDLSSLSQSERRSLRQLGVRIGAFCVHLPSQLNSETAAFAVAFAAAGGLTPEPRTFGLRGLARIAGLSVPVDELERLGEALRAAPRRNGGATLTVEALESRGLSAEGADRLLRALGFIQSGRGGQPLVWRRRRAPAGPTRAVHSPFAALKQLTPAPRPHRRRARRV